MGWREARKLRQGPTWYRHLDLLERVGVAVPLLIFAIIAEVRDFATEWLWTYNNERPNMALGGITPNIKTAMAA